MACRPAPTTSHDLFSLHVHRFPSRAAVSDIACWERPLQNAVHDMVEVAVTLLRPTKDRSFAGGFGALAGFGRLVGSVGTAPGYRLHAAERVAGSVHATGRPLLLSGVDQAGFINFVPKNRPVSSSVVVPMRIRAGR
jgi:hypothetical protein